MDRFDFTKAERELLNSAVSLNVVDPVGLACIVFNAAGNFDEIASELLDAAYSNIHCEPQIHTDWVNAIEQKRQADIATEEAAKAYKESRRRFDY